MALQCRRISTYVGALIRSRHCSLLPGGSRISSSTDNYCEDNPGVCIGVPVVVAVAVLIILVILLLLFACPDSRRMFCELTRKLCRCE